VFDLDDTLIDSARVLVPEALARVAAATGVHVERLDPRGKTVDELLAGVEATEEQRAAAAREWYAPGLPPLDLVPGARALLEELRADPRVRLVLLTRGDPARQQAKVDACGARALFDEVCVRPSEEPGTKRDDLRAILTASGLPPRRCVVVGDDERDELAHARALGCIAVPVPARSWDDVRRIVAEA